jgi:O-antigen ligase
MKYRQMRRAPAAAVAGMAAAGAGYAVARGGALPVAVVGGLALAFAVTARARTVVLAATVASLVVGSTALPGVKQSVFYVRFLLLGAFVIANLLDRPVRGSKALRGLHWPLLALVALAIVSALWSVDPAVSASRAVGLGLMMVAVITAAYRSWWTREHVARDIATIGSVVGIMLMVGLAGSVAGVEWAVVGGRFRGIMENPNTIGVMGGLFLPVAVGFAVVRRGRLRAWWLAVTTAVAASLLLSQSRGGIVAASAGLVILLVLWRGGRRALAVAATCSLAAALFMVLTTSAVSTPEPLESVTVRFQQDPTAGGRFAAWRLTLGLVREKPVVGWGFGTTEEVFGSQTTAISQVFQGGLVHNSYLQALLELGPGGLLLLLLAAGIALRRGLPGDRADPLRTAMYGALVAGLLNGIVESSMLSAGSVFAFSFWMIAAASVRLGTLAGADSKRPAPLNSGS